MLNFAAGLITGAVTVAGLIYVGGKLVLRKLGTVDVPLSTEDGTIGEDSLAQLADIEAPDGLDHLEYRPSTPAAETFRQTIETNNGFAQELARRSSQYVTLLGIESETYYDDEELAMVETISRMSGYLVLEMLCEAEWLIVPRERVAALLDAANGNDSDYDEE